MTILLAILKKVPWKFVMALITGVILAGAIFLCCGCLSMPDCKGDSPPICCDYYLCLYLNQKNPDKSACAALCAECAKNRRLDRCILEGNRTGGMRLQECWDKLD